MVGDVARLHLTAVRSVVLMDGDGTPDGVGPGCVHGLFFDPYATADPPGCCPSGCPGPTAR